MSRALAVGLVCLSATAHAGTLSTVPPDHLGAWTKINTSQTPTDAINWRHRDIHGVLRSIVELPAVWMQRNMLVDDALELYNPAHLRLAVWVKRTEMLDDEISINIGPDSGSGYLITVTSSLGVRQYNRVARGAPEPSGFALAVCGVLALRRRHSPPSAAWI